MKLLAAGGRPSGAQGRGVGCEGRCREEAQPGLGCKHRWPCCMTDPLVGHLLSHLCLGLWRSVFSCPFSRLGLDGRATSSLTCCCKCAWHPCVIPGQCRCSSTDFLHTAKAFAIYHKQGILKLQVKHTMSAFYLLAVKANPFPRYLVSTSHLRLSMSPNKWNALNKGLGQRSACWPHYEGPPNL